MFEQRFRRAVGVLAFALLIVPGMIRAQEGVDDAIRISRQGLMFNARSLGMGNAYSTIGGDFTALRMNPATLGLSEGTTYTMSVNTNGFLYQSDFHATTDNFTATNTALSQAGLTVPFKLDSTRQMVIGLGYTQDKDFTSGGKYDGFNSGTSSFVTDLANDPNTVSRTLGLIYPTYDNTGKYLGDQTILNGNFQEHGYILNTGEMLHFSGGVSIEVVNSIFFGLSGSYNLGTFQSDAEYTADNTKGLYPDTLRTVPTDPKTAGFQSASYRDVVNTQYKGGDVRFGLLYKFYNFIALSASFKVPFAHTVDQTRYLSGNSSFVSGNSFNVDQVLLTQSYTIKPPYEATVGGMVNLWILTGTAELTYVDYTQMELSGGADVPALSAVNKRIKDEFTRVVNANIGAEFRLPFTGLSARAGAMYRPSPYKSDPGRYDQKFITLGIGINSADRLNFDIGYLYGWWDSQKSEETTASDPTATQTIAYHNLLLTVKLML